MKKYFDNFSIVIPCFNDENIIEEKILLMQRLFKGWETAPEVIFVDDGSKDKTISVIKRTSESINFKYKLIPLTHNIGKGGAIKAGVKEAAFPVVFFTDSDLPYHFSAFSDSMEEFKDIKTTIVIGSRSHSESEAKSNFFRKLLSFSFSFYVNLLLNLNIKDTQCGFKGFRKKWFLENINNFHEDGFAFDVELLSIAKLQKVEIVPIPIRYMMESRPSHINFITDSIKMGLDIIRISLNIRKLKNES